MAKRDDVAVVRVGGYDVPRRLPVPLSPLPGANQLGSYSGVIFIDDDGEPAVEEFHLLANPPLRAEESMSIDLGALARDELHRKLQWLRQRDLARERGGVFIGVLDAEGKPPRGSDAGDELDELRPSPEAVAIAKETSTLVYGRRRGARMDPAFLAGVAQLIVERPEWMTVTARVEELAQRYDVVPETVWRWKRLAEERSGSVR